MRETETRVLRYNFPEPGALFGSGEYAKAPSLARRVARMIRENPEFAHLQNWRVVVVWKAGKSKKLGQCEKVKGALQAFVGPQVPFVITIYYDMCRMFGFTEGQMDALLDHELRHCGFNAQGAPELVRHDVEEFFGTVQRYGLWFEDVRSFAKLCQQVGSDG
jgi:hypothetical protein